MNESPLDEKSRAMLRALAELGAGWHSRAEIAAHIGKDKLNPVEITALDVLATTGTIERAMQQTENIQINRWAYRLKEGSN